MNPFNFGSIATGQWFVNREKELKKLKNELLSGSKMLLVSPRRYGKTSLAYKLQDDFKKNKNTIVVYIDTIACATLKQFINKYSSSIGKSLESTTDKVIAFFKDIIPSLRPIIQASSGPEGNEVSVQIVSDPDEDTEESLFEKILDLPEQAAVKRNKKVIIILDEFQAIREINTDKGRNSLLWKIRSKIQKHRHVGYLFAGSQKHILEQMTIPHDSPFFKMLNIMRLEKIDENIFYGFIKKLFKKGKKPQKEPILKNIIKRAENVPFYVLNLCHEIYEYARDHRGKINVHCVEECVKMLVRKNHFHYEKQWEKLSPSQKNILKAVASGDKQNFYSIDIIKKYELKSIGGTQKALKHLIEGQILLKDEETYTFDDIWLKEWIRWRI